MQIRPPDSFLNSITSTAKQAVDSSVFAKLLEQTEQPPTGSESLNSLSTSVDTAMFDQSQSSLHGSEQLKQAFTDFVGQTFFGELIKSYRSTQQPAAYFHGGQAEKIFQGQLDQVMSEQLSQRSADQIAGPMYQQFLAKRP